MHRQEVVDAVIAANPDIDRIRLTRIIELVYRLRDLPSQRTRAEKGLAGENTR